MPEGRGLGGLQMGEARHHRAGMGLGLFGQRQLQVGELRVEFVDRIAHPEPEIDRHLVVARARRMQPARRLADDLLEARLDVHMDVFERAREFERPALDFARDLIQTPGDRRYVVLGQDARRAQHGRMRL